MGTVTGPKITIGYNMKCQNVIVKVIVIDDSKDGLYCISDGIKIRIDRDSLSEYLNDTPENRKLLKSKFNI